MQLCDLPAILGQRWLSLKASSTPNLPNRCYFNGGETEAQISAPLMSPTLEVQLFLWYWNSRMQYYWTGETLKASNCSEKQLVSFSKWHPSRKTTWQGPWRELGTLLCFCRASYQISTLTFLHAEREPGVPAGSQPLGRAGFYDFLQSLQQLLPQHHRCSNTNTRSEKWSGVVAISWHWLHLPTQVPASHPLAERLKAHLANFFSHWWTMRLMLLSPNVYLLLYSVYLESCQRGRQHYKKLVKD